ncbi:DUF389 domain-containing protein [Altererythrobacter sp. MF3-039]|uniref:DUF389 domain-containing protein n=1 Tax=Altererythrobacter sp. MF3-039 TaxID=3252901 RepID=UPI00390C4549
MSQDASLPLADQDPTEEEAKTDRAKRRSRYFLLRTLANLRAWWREVAIDDIDQSMCIERIRGESLLTSRYLFMICMSAGIAVLGLLLSSPAVVIGAMLLSPLMNPIVGSGFAFAIGDFVWLRRCGRALLVGSIVAILFCAFVVFLSPLQTVTEEIAARTRPNIFDLLVALFSALAGAYALIRGKEGTIVGVAIATALMPPLAVVGFGMATLNTTVFGGALMLFMTNLIVIALTAALMARLYGFRSTLSSKQSLGQFAGILAAFVALAIPLGISLDQIVSETNGTRIARGTITDTFPDKARITALDIDWDSEPVLVSATVLTPEFRMSANTDIARGLSRQLGQPTEVVVDQLQVSTDPGAVEQAELVQARAAEQAAATERQIAALTSQLAIIAGVERKDVTIDRGNRRALVSAKPLDELGLAGYRTLESRVASQLPGWTIQMRPPLMPLPNIALEDGAIAPGEAQDVALLIWAGQRTGTAIALEGPAEPVAVLAGQLREAGVSVVVEPQNPRDRIATRWTVSP